MEERQILQSSKASFVQNMSKAQFECYRVSGFYIFGAPLLSYYNFFPYLWMITFVSSKLYFFNSKTSIKSHFTLVFLCFSWSTPLLRMCQILCDAEMYYMACIFKEPKLLPLSVTSVPIGNGLPFSIINPLFRNSIPNFHFFSLDSPLPTQWYCSTCFPQNCFLLWFSPIQCLKKNYPIISYVCLYVSGITFLNGCLCSLYSWRQSSVCTLGPCHILHYIRIQEIVGHTDK